MKWTPTPQAWSAGDKENTPHISMPFTVTFLFPALELTVHDTPTCPSSQKRRNRLDPGEGQRLYIPANIDDCDDLATSAEHLKNPPDLPEDRQTSGFQKECAVRYVSVYKDNDR